MNTIKNISLIIVITISCSCSVSEKSVEKFAIKLTEDFMNNDSISLYKKQMDGETAGKYGFLIFTNYDETFESPKQFVELSKQRYLESKDYQLEMLGRLVSRFNYPFQPKIVSVKTDSLWLEEEKEVRNILSIFKSKKQCRLYNVRQILKDEKGDSIYFRPGFIVVLGNDLYFDKQGLKYSDTKFNY
jgi:hypothetical protein